MKHLPIILYPIFLGIFMAAFWYDIHTVPLVLSHIPFALASLDALSLKQWSTSLVLTSNIGVSIWYHVNEYDLYTIRHPSRQLWGVWSLEKFKRGDYAKSLCFRTKYGPNSTYYRCQKHWTYWENTTLPSNTFPTPEKAEKAIIQPPKDLIKTVKMSTRLDFTLALITLHYMGWQMSLPLDLALALALIGSVGHVISQSDVLTATVLFAAVVLALIRARSVHTIVSGGIVAVALHFFSVGLTYEEDEHAARWAHSLWHILAGWSASHAIRARMGQWKLSICKSPKAQIAPDGIAVGLVSA